MLRSHYLSTACAALLGCSLLALGGTATAGTPSMYPSQLTPLPDAVVMASADLNGDGLTDVVVSQLVSDVGGVAVFLAQKGGGFAAPVLYATPCGVWPLALADLGNGHVDIVAGTMCWGGDSPVSVLLGNGDGSFQPAVDYSVGLSDETVTGIFSVTVGDATGNGKPDVMIVAESGAYVIPGRGDGTLDVANAQPLTLYNGPGSTEGSEGGGFGVVVTDINSDGHPDIVLADGWNQEDASVHSAVNVYLGTAGGQFSPTPSQIITVGPAPQFGVNNDNLLGGSTPSVVVADFLGGTVQILQNNAGTLVPQPPMQLFTSSEPGELEPAQVHVTDVDGDGFPDLFVAISGANSVAIYYGVAGGGFESKAALVPTGYTTGDAAVVKNSSGKLDLVSIGTNWGGAAGLVVTRNLGNRQYLSYQRYDYADEAGNGLFAKDFASADFNGDGKPDVVIANSGDDTLSVLLNDGKGGFTLAPVIAVTGFDSNLYAVAAGDVNADGKADIVTADASGHLYVYLSKGDGSFQAPVTSGIASSYISGLALADLNGDGKLDAVVPAYDSNQVQMCRGDGTGSFNCAAFAPIAVGTPRRVALADFNADGKLDLAISTDEPDGLDEEATDAYVYLGKGDGSFAATPAATLSVTGGGNEIAAGDIQGDGKISLAFGSYGNSVSVFAGKGDGSFAAPAIYASGTSGYSGPKGVALGDLNGDGKLDLMSANYFEEFTFSVRLNKGDGSFGEPTHYVTAKNPHAVMAMDVDGDGLQDILVRNGGWYNPRLNRQVTVYLHNHAPVVSSTSLTLNQNTSGSGQVTATDAEGDSLSYAVATQPAHGTATLNAESGAFTYTPASGYSGADSFTVTASDGLNTSAPASVNATVSAASGGSSGSSSGGGGLGLIALLALGGLALRRRRG